MTLLADLVKLDEVVQPLPQDMPLEQMIAELEKRLSAARRGLAFTNRLKNPAQKKKHLSSVLTNMNMIRGQLNRAIKEIEQFVRAENDYQHTSDVEQPAPSPKPSSPSTWIS
jgi:hypothetical protein